MNMDIFSSILLGAVQGVTEFLPISSSGHLILIREFLGLDLAGSFAYDAVLQLATSLAVLLYFRKDLIDLVRTRDEKNKILFWAIVFGTIPAVLIGFIFENKIDGIFRNSNTVALALVAGSILFFVAERYSKSCEKESAKSNEFNAVCAPRDISATRGFVVGCFQALSLIPGMSRSGSTISGALLLNIKRKEAVRFSFILSLPILLGSGLKKLIDLGGTGGIDTSLIIGSVVAFFVGLASIHFLIVYLRRHTLNVFIFYRILLAVIIFIFL
jgi:undecaprenyl-diphosphatase